MVAEVKTLYETNCRSIPDMLRLAAASIETEEAEGFARTTTMLAIQLSENGDVQVYGWGDTDDLHALGLIERGKAEILRNMMGED